MILVTGSAGQLGGELQKLYSKEEALFLSKDQLDITNYKELESLIKINSIDTIINCAAYTAVDKAEDEAEICKQVNTDGPANLAKLSKEYKLKIIHISTDYVFDGTNYKPYKEADTTSPNSVYGTTKLKGEEEILKSAHSFIIIRTSWVYSEFGKNFVKTIYSLAKEKEQLSIVGDQIASPTYAFDLAEFIKNVLPTIKEDTKEIYHFANEGVASWYDLAYEIMQLKELNCLVKPIETKDYPTKAARPHYSVLNKNKAKNEFNIKIRHWKEALKECLEKLS